MSVNDANDVRMICMDRMRARMATFTGAKGLLLNSAMRLQTGGH